MPRRAVARHVHARLPRARAVPGPRSARAQRQRLRGGGLRLHLARRRQREANASGQDGAVRRRVQQRVSPHGRPVVRVGAARRLLRSARVPPPQRGRGEPGETRRLRRRRRRRHADARGSVRAVHRVRVRRADGVSRDDVSVPVADREAGRGVEAFQGVVRRRERAEASRGLRGGKDARPAVFEKRGTDRRVRVAPGRDGARSHRVHARDERERRVAETSRGVQSRVRGDGGGRRGGAAVDVYARVHVDGRRREARRGRPHVLRVASVRRRLKTAREERAGEVRDETRAVGRRRRGAHPSRRRRRRRRRRRKRRRSKARRRRRRRPRVHVPPAPGEDRTPRARERVLRTQQQPQGHLVRRRHVRRRRGAKRVEPSPARTRRRAGVRPARRDRRRDARPRPEVLRLAPARDTAAAVARRRLDAVRRPR